MNSRLKTSAAVAAVALAFIGGWEGLSLRAYLDGGGVPTICRGSTRGVKLGQTATAGECDAMFLRDLIEHETAMLGCLKRPDDLSDDTYVALLSFTYNVGGRAFCGSTLVRLVNGGQMQAACNQLPRWNKDNGKVIWGLTRRRISERDLCLGGLE